MLIVILDVHSGIVPEGTCPAFIRFFFRKGKKSLCISLSIVMETENKHSFTQHLEVRGRGVVSSHGS